MSDDTPTPNDQPKYQQIQERAYAIYIAEGFPSGRCGDHWRMAEEQLRAELRQDETQPVFPQPARAGRRRK